MSKYLVIPVENEEDAKNIVEEAYGSVIWNHDTPYPETYPITTLGAVVILDKNPIKASEAAPQMLEALERLTKAAIELNNQRPDNPNLAPRFAALGEVLSAVKQAEAAIAAAKGE